MLRMANSTVCFPPGASAELTADCFNVVSVNFLDIQNKKTAMFPDKIDSGSMYHKLFNNIIGISVNNDSEKFTINPGDTFSYIIIYLVTIGIV